MEVVSLNRTLDQELMAITRGASLECPACGEFLMRTSRGVRCPECGSTLERELGSAEARLQLDLQAG